MHCSYVKNNTFVFAFPVLEITTIQLLRVLFFCFFPFGQWKCVFHYAFSFRDSDTGARGRAPSEILNWLSIILI